MRTLDSPETDTPVVDAPDEPRETVETPQAVVLEDPQRRREESAEARQNYDFDSLKGLAKREDDHEMQVFKAELREALSHPSRLPGDELSWAVQYDKGSDEAFLRQLWHDLYGDETP